MAYPWGSTVTDAIARLAAVVNSTFANGAHRTNFVPRLNDTATVIAAVAEAADYADAAATDAATYAGRMKGTSATSRTIGAGSFQFTISADDIFIDEGRWVRVQSRAAPTVDYMLGQIASGATSTSVTIAVTADNAHGSGAHTDWDLLITEEPGSEGPDGPQGAPAGRPFLWSTAVSGADQGSGKVWANSASLTAAGVLYISEFDADGAAIADILTRWGASSNDPKTTVEFRDPDDATNYYIVNIKSVRTDLGGFDSFVIEHEGHGGTLTNGMLVYAQHVLHGNQGTAGATGATGATGSTGAAGATGVAGPAVAAVACNFDTGTTDTNPGAGEVAFNNATPASVTVIYLNDSDADAQNIETWIGRLDDSDTTGDRGEIKLVATATPTTKLSFKVTGSVTDGTGYWKIPVTHVSGTTLPTVGARLAIDFSRTGNKGTDGVGGDVFGPASSVDNSLAVFDGTGGKTLKDGGIVLSAFIKTVLDDANAGAALTTLGAQPLDATLTSLAALTGAGVLTATSTDNMAMRTIGVGGSTEIPDRAAADGRYAPLATAYLAGGTDVAIADGGTGQSTAAAAFAALKQAASDTATGVVELAIASEINTGTDAARAITPDAFAASNFGSPVVSYAVSDPGGSAITTGDGKAYFRVPATLNGMNLIGVTASLSTVSSSGIPTVQLRRKRSGSDVDMLSTKLTIDASEVDSSTAAAAAVINSSNDDVATGDQIYFDIDVAGTGAKGLNVEMTFQLP